MTREQRTNANVLRIIANHVTEETTIEYNGKQYRTFLWDNGSATVMRIVISENGWSVCPVEWDIETCMKV